MKTWNNDICRIRGTRVGEVSVPNRNAFENVAVTAQREAKHSNCDIFATSVA